MKNKLINVTDIVWNTDGDAPELPVSMIVFPVTAGIENPDEDLSDWLSDKFGWPVYSVKFKEIDPDEYQAGLPKFLYMADAQHADAEDVSLLVVAANPAAAWNLYGDAALTNEWFLREEFANLAVRVRQIHPLGEEYDATGSLVLPWENLSETVFNIDPENSDTIEP